jgi:chromosome segregation ATPase
MAQRAPDAGANDRAIVEINQFDVELYEYVKELTAEQVVQKAAKSAATRHMRPLYARASAREALEAENKRLKTELIDQGAERERVAAELSRQKEERARLATEHERLQVELSRQHTELSRQQAELSRQHTELSRLEAQSSRQQAESALLKARLTDIIDALQLRLDAVYSSNSWKVTEPLRKLSELRRKARLVR